MKGLASVEETHTFRRNHGVAYPARGKGGGMDDDGFLPVMDGLFGAGGFDEGDDVEDMIAARAILPGSPGFELLAECLQETEEWAGDEDHAVQDRQQRLGEAGGVMNTDDLRSQFSPEKNGECKPSRENPEPFGTIEPGEDGTDEGREACACQAIEHEDRRDRPLDPALELQPTAGTLNAPLLLEAEFERIERKEYRFGERADERDSNHRCGKKEQGDKKHG